MTPEHRTEPPSVETLQEARRALEAVLLVATDPTPVELLAQLVELPADIVDAMCRELADEYETDRRGFQLVQVAGGWRYQTHPDTHPYVERYAMEGIPNRLSSAALETLAIVAYKQPISRGQIGAIRGVNADGVLRTLVQRGYVTELGRDDGPGQATLFGTTDFFLEQLGLMSTADLPPLGDFVPSAEVLEALEQTLKIDGESPVEVEVEAEHEAGTEADSPSPTEAATDETEPESGTDDVDLSSEPVTPDGGEEVPLTTVQPAVTLAPLGSSPAPDDVDGSVEPLEQPADGPEIEPAADLDDRGRSLGPGSAEPEDLVDQAGWPSGSSEPERHGQEDPSGRRDAADPEIATGRDGTDSQPGGAHRLDAVAARFRSTKAVTNGSVEHRQRPEDA